MSIVCPAEVASKPRDVSRPSEMSRTPFGSFQFLSNFLSASRTSTYGLYGDTAVLEAGMRSEFAAGLKAVVIEWRTCRVPDVMYPTIPLPPVRNDRMNWLLPP